MSRRDEVRKRAEQSIARGDAVGWFEELYRSAGDDWSRIPWADSVPNPHLLRWLGTPAARAVGPRALVVGCGLGDELEGVGRQGVLEVAFEDFVDRNETPPVRRFLALYERRLS